MYITSSLLKLIYDNNVNIEILFVEFISFDNNNKLLSYIISLFFFLLSLICL